MVQPNDSQLELSIAQVSYGDESQNWTLIRDLLPTWVVDLVNDTQSAHAHHGEDRLIWVFSPNGLLSTKSVFDILMQHQDITNIVFWELQQGNATQRVKCLIWLPVNDGLKNNDKRQKCGMDTNVLCSLCQTHVETNLHILRDSQQVKPIWQHLLPPQRVQDFFQGKFSNWVKSNINGGCKADVKDRKLLFKLTIRSIWNKRNQVVFVEKQF